MKIDVIINLDWYIVKDKNGNISLFTSRPMKVWNDWGCFNFSFAFDEDTQQILPIVGRINIDLWRLKDFFPQIRDYFDFSKVQWEDDEPKQLKDILKGEYKNGK